MTENKRFTTDNGSNEDVCLVDNVTGKEFESDFDKIVELLNALHEENEKLKKEYNKLKHWHIEAECEKDMYQNDVLSLKKQNDYLKDDNEELKSKVIYEKRQHKHWKNECLENIKEISQLKREIVQLKGDDSDD